jgi:hypothetical protein
MFLGLIYGLLRIDYGFLNVVASLNDYDPNESRFITVFGIFASTESSL